MPQEALIWIDGNFYEILWVRLCGGQKSQKGKPFFALCHHLLSAVAFKPVSFSGVYKFPLSQVQSCPFFHGYSQSPWPVPWRTWIDLMGFFLSLLLMQSIYSIMKLKVRFILFCFNKHISSINWNCYIPKKPAFTCVYIHISWVLVVSLQRFLFGLAWFPGLVDLWSSH